MKDIEYKSNNELVGLILGLNSDNLKINNLEDIMIHPMTIQGVGEKKAEKLYAIRELSKRLMNPSIKRPVMSCPEDVYDYIAPRLQYEQKEHFGIIIMNVKNHILGYEEISVGSLTASVVHPREVFAELLKYNAASFIIVHNHPSGDPTPSREDITTTKRLIAAGKIMDIPALDHIIIGCGKFISLKEKGFLD